MKTCLAVLALVIVLNNSALAEKERVYVGPYTIEYDYGNIDHNIIPLPEQYDDNVTIYNLLISGIEVDPRGIVPVTEIFVSLPMYNTSPNLEEIMDALLGEQNYTEETKTISDSSAIVRYWTAPYGPIPQMPFVLAGFYIDDAFCIMLLRGFDEEQVEHLLDSLKIARWLGF
ncbi:MAG: hypothetical protein AB2L21_10710 [Anaerolineaceae bacterium]